MPLTKESMDEETACKDFGKVGKAKYQHLPSKDENR